MRGYVLGPSGGGARLQQHGALAGMRHRRPRARGCDSAPVCGRRPRQCAAPGLSCAELLRALTAHAALRQGRFNPGIQSPIPDPFNFAGSRIFF